MRVWMIVACCALLIAGAAGAQVGPAGNAHPETETISEARQASNPFARAPGGERMSLDEKQAFADAVDLSPLRDLAAFHGGRVKILDTLARETVAGITGRADYFDVKPITDDRGRYRWAKLERDPVFTFLDMAADPWYYIDKPSLAVGYLPLREAILETLFDDNDLVDRWKRLGRVSPQMLVTAGPAVMQRQTTNAEMQLHMSRLQGAMSQLDSVWMNLLVIAPDHEGEPWRHISTAPEGSAVHTATTQLAAAWQAGDADGVNSAVLGLAEALPAINPELYPTTTRRLELAYNQSNPFEWGFWLYAVSLIALLLAFGTGRKWLGRLGVTVLGLALALHGAGFTARCIISERFAIQNQFESMTGLSLFAVIVGIVLMLARRQYLFGAAAAAVGFMILITATQTGIPGDSIQREAAILNTSVLLKYHVTTVLVSYGLISLGFIVSLFYLGAYYTRAKGEDATTTATALGIEEDAPRGIARVLSDLDKAQMIVLQLAFWTLGVGILLGAWWADHSWGRWWAWDPKEMWALITWIVYLIVIHVRFTTGGKRALVTSWLSVVGFFIMLWTYFGVNLLLPGLHAYA